MANPPVLVAPEVELELPEDKSVEFELPEGTAADDDVVELPLVSVGSEEPEPEWLPLVSSSSFSSPWCPPPCSHS